ncbi:MAG TPA: endonuclease domain-containing protein [Spirochaetota bacterium]|nr:endonuclease domain-containing protein [Spirochaetota bacterium]
MNEITKLCKDLRNNLTDAEKCLWVEIRNKKLGVKFRRQHPIVYHMDNKTGFFIADFACLERKLVIEIDGKIHDNQKERDITREYVIRYLGFRVIRFDNDQVVRSMPDVIGKIRSEISLY